MVPMDDDMNIVTLQTTRGLTVRLLGLVGLGGNWMDDDEAPRSGLRATGG